MIEILYEDALCLGVVKPVGVSSQKDPADPEDMTFLLREQFGREVYPVHRLDKMAGGVMLYAKTSSAAGKLGAQIEAGGFHKEYLAVVSGKPEKESGTLRDYLVYDRQKGKSFPAEKTKPGAKEALLSYTVLQSAETENGTVSLLSILLKTGRTHQIRAQFSSRALPLLGDGKYGSTEKGCRLALWSHSLIARSPASSKTVSLQKDPPDVFPWSLFSTEKKTGSD